MTGNTTVVSAEAVTLDTQPHCWSSHDGSAWPGELLYFTCSVGFNGNLAPLMNWTRNDGNPASNSTDYVSETLVTSTLYVVAEEAELYGPYTCLTYFNQPTLGTPQYIEKAGNAPNYTYNWTSVAITLESTTAYDSTTGRPTTDESWYQPTTSEIFTPESTTPDMTVVDTERPTTMDWWPYPTITSDQTETSTEERVSTESIATAETTTWETMVTGTEAWPQSTDTDTQSQTSTDEGASETSGTVTTSDYTTDYTTSWRSANKRMNI